MVRLMIKICLYKSPKRKYACRKILSKMWLETQKSEYATCFQKKVFGSAFFEEMNYLLELSKSKLVNPFLTM